MTLFDKRFLQEGHIGSGSSFLEPSADAFADPE